VLVQSDKVNIVGRRAIPPYVVKYVSDIILSGTDAEFHIYTDLQQLTVINYDVNYRYSVNYEDIPECQT
jgi:hypothetical protein